MKTTRMRRAALFAVSAVSVTAAALIVGTGGAVASPASGGANPIVRIDDGVVRGTTAGTVDEFLGLPLRCSPHRQPAVAPSGPAGLVEGRPRRHAVRAELPAGNDAQSVPPARADQRGLPVPERVRADAARR